MTITILLFGGSCALMWDRHKDLGRQRFDEGMFDYGEAVLSAGYYSRYAAILASLVWLVAACAEKYLRETAEPAGSPQEDFADPPGQ